MDKLDQEKSEKGVRRKARELALAYLYQCDLNIGPLTESAPKFIQHFSSEEEPRVFFDQIVAGVREKKEEIDKKIEASADNWKLYRMEAIDRSILRLSTWELIACPETDFQVVIDEAVELAKTFGSENSSAFVNGILDKLAHQMRTPSVGTKT